MKKYRFHLVALLGFFCLGQKTFSQPTITESELLANMVNMEKAEVKKEPVNDAIAQRLNQTLLFEIKSDAGTSIPVSPLPLVFNAFRQYSGVLTNFNHFNLLLARQDTSLLGVTARHGLSGISIESLKQSGFTVDDSIDLMTTRLRIAGALSTNLLTPQDSINTKVTAGMCTALNCFIGIDTMYLYTIGGEIFYLEYQNIPILEKLISEKIEGNFTQGLYVMRVPAEFLQEFPGMSGSPFYMDKSLLGILSARVVLPFTSNEGALVYLVFSATKKSNF